ncbi:DUF4065 domain-containing protein [Streptococcus uberis]|uniref:Panacea domain-containing protein n=1 Tax=Streptococcus uberis TaxID=1349 RepID=UPI0027DB4351|nr:type II toxin-antitoxin system antitoxin SocA domain-containing protein [Streptococcus uberis]MCK1158314.1 DUF4065 domain-containing protein [Streptococcus uberis]MCK1224185.1 DUF4065 domain-containing protein [Streptococcus uberis]
MFQHFVLVASSYIRGERIGYHLVSKGQLDTNLIEEKMMRLSQINREDVGVHSFVTESDKWESVTQLDSFFEDIIVCEDFEEFERVLERDLEISAIDVAKFFLAMRPISHLKLQKLVYLAYKEYLLKHQEQLFKEEIVAYQYGPVIEEVYQKFKSHGSNTITIDDTTQYILKDVHLPQALGRMLLSKDAEKIVPVLLKVIKQYGSLSASKLVELTHRKGGPWETVYKPYSNCSITDDVILDKAKFEIL